MTSKRYKKLPKKTLELQSENIEKLIAQRQVERSKKNFKKADEIREYLEKIGIGIEDAENKTKWFEI